LPSAFQHHVESAATEPPRSRVFRLRGWCFHRTTAIESFSTRVAGLSFPGCAPLPRDDVADAFPATPHAHRSGFCLDTILPPGPVAVELHARLVDGTSELILRLDSSGPPEPGLWQLWRDPDPALDAHRLRPVPSHTPRPLRPEKFPAGAHPDSAARFVIVTPSFQQGRFLPETLRSVLEQDYPHVAYGVLDGGSTDGSAAIVASFADRLTCWSSAPDGGQTAAIAAGFAHIAPRADDIMGWINSDDFLLPGALRCVASYFARHPEVDVVYGHRILVDEESREIGRWFLPPHDPHVLRLNDFVPQETLFWRRRIWEKVGGLDQQFHFAMDWDLLLRMADAGARIERLPYFLGCFRVHAAQKTVAQMGSRGQAEIDALRVRTWGRALGTSDLLGDPRLHAYLRHSARLEWLWSWGWRGR
jgi:hypothetical protein